MSDLKDKVAEYLKNSSSLSEILHLLGHNAYQGNWSYVRDLQFRFYDELERLIDNFEIPEGYFSEAYDYLTGLKKIFLSHRTQLKISIADEDIDKFNQSLDKFLEETSK